MDMIVHVDGLKEVMNAIEKAFPKDVKMQRKLLNQSMSGAAKGSIVKIAKQKALQGDGSGALSESIGVRAKSLSRARSRGAAASVTVTPIRSNRKAIAKYISYYRRNSAKQVIDGIRHGHLVEFGHRIKNGFVSPRPFLWPAAAAGQSAYVSLFAKSVRKKIESAVRRARRK